MSRRHLLVSAAVALTCAGILVLFTDIEVTAVRWLNCGPLAAGNERRTELCR
jgi:hypothetical protein